MSKKSVLARAADKLNHNALLWSKQAVQAMRSTQCRDLNKRVAFVAGVQRSGTNMLMDVLERCYETDVYHERDNRAFDDYEMRPRHVIHELVNGSNAPLVIFKALCELQDVGKLLDEFAPAKALWIVRSFEDVVNSHLAIWTGMPSSIRAIAVDRNSAAWRGRGMSDETHALVRDLYHDDISNASACALFWYFRNALFFEQGLDRDGRVCLIRYESLVTEPSPQFSRVFDFLGLEYSHRFAKGVSSGSVRKGRAPLIDPAIRDVCESLAARFEPLFVS